MAKPEQPQPVSLHTEDPRLPRTLRRELEKLMEQKKEALAAGYPKTFDEYRYRVGEVNGLLTAINICVNYESDLSGN